MADVIRLAVIGVGNMARAHMKNAREMEHVELTAVCDVVAENAEAAAEEHGCRAFTDHRELIDAGVCDAVLVATPHFSHTTIGVDALEAGLHVLVEKPISVHKADCEELIAAHTDPKQVFAAMFNQRTDPHYRKLKQLIDTGELGQITRVNWIITTWFRTQTYYNSGGWRATWKGEGGGVLLNQCPHQLDLMQWLFGMPKRVRAFCHLGKWHDIEVEDEVTAYLEYEGGATGVFITSTGETPGTNRLEVTGTRGRVIIEPGQPIRFERNETPTDERIKNDPAIFAAPQCWHVEIPAEGSGGQHREVLANFIDAIRTGAPLIAPAAEGVRSVELGNAMLYSAMTDSTVEMPLDGSAYAKCLQQLIDKSEAKKQVAAPAQPADMSASF